MTKIAHFYTICDPTRKNIGFEGGGPVNYRNIIRNLSEMGFDVRIITPENFNHGPISQPRPSDSVLNVLQDYANDPFGSRQFDRRQLEEIRESETPLVFSECAYTACSDLPYAMNNEGYIVYHAGTQLARMSRRLIDRANLVITVSPLHKSEIEKHLEIKLGDKGYCYLQEVDTKMFYNRNLRDRTIKYVYTGALNYAKGTQNIINAFGQYGLELYGPPMKILRYDQMPDLYNMSETFVHYPNWMEPFCLGASEAALCGCKLDLDSDRVGALSYGKDLGDPQIYQDSKEEFKCRIQSIMPA